MIEKSNYEINKYIKLGKGTVNGQGVGPVSQMRYGLFPMSYNGCEMIAIYNFLYLEKIDNPNLAKIAFEMYPKQLESSKYGIVSFWNAHHPFHGLHTVCVESIKNGIRVYNRSNKKDVPVDYNDYSEFVDRARFICGYLFK